MPYFTPFPIASIVNFEYVFVCRKQCRIFGVILEEPKMNRIKEQHQIGIIFLYYPYLSKFSSKLCSSLALGNFRKNLFKNSLGTFDMLIVSRTIFFQLLIGLKSNAKLELFFYTIHIYPNSVQSYVQACFWEIFVKIFWKTL